jgi:hypothetical protein
MISTVAVMEQPSIRAAPSQTGTELIGEFPWKLIWLRPRSSRKFGRACLQKRGNNPGSGIGQSVFIPEHNLAVVLNAA